MERAAAEMGSALGHLLGGDDRKQALGILADLVRTAAERAVAEEQRKPKPVSG